MRVRDLNWFRLEEYLGRDDRIVLPIGSTEQHAYLSLETDNILAEHVAAEAAEPLGIPVLPVLPYGLTPSFGAYPGSPTLRVRTLLAIVGDLLDSLYSQGFRRVLIVNGHGGNSPVDGARREWVAAHEDAEVLFHNWWLGPRVWQLVQELDPGASHASWMENFPWTRLDGVELPAGRKEQLPKPIPAAPHAMREAAGDGQYGGFYALPDEDVLRVWAAGVEETRELLVHGWHCRAGNTSRVSRTERFDAFQRRHTALGFPIAVVYKILDDRAGYLAALITYYGFLSLFPLLLLFFSIVGYVLHGDPGLQHRVSQSALRDFPIVGPQLRSGIGSYSGNGVALAVGVAGSLYGGLGIMQAAQTAFNQIYGIPRSEQPSAIASRLRSLGLLALLGSGIIATTALTIFVSTVSSIGGTTIGSGLMLAGDLLSYALAVVLFTGAFQLLTARELRWRNVLTGGMLAAASWLLLQAEGAAYVAHTLRNASQVYGSFALVLALLGYIFLQALAVVVGAEINVVIHQRLWPRAFLAPFSDRVELTDVDRLLYTSYARAQRFKRFQRIEVEFEQEDGASIPPEHDPGISKREC